MIRLITYIIFMIVLSFPWLNINSQENYNLTETLSDSIIVGQDSMNVCKKDAMYITDENNDTTGIFSEYTKLALNVDDNKPYEIRKHKRPWIALAEDVGLDLFFHIATRYIANEDYAQISWASIKKNFETGFIWDNDSFKTNLFSHPYQGGLYYNSARSNGLNFWESAPYAFLGSLIWEMFMETQPPSTNDIISTTLGGIGIGEATYRLSSVILRGNCSGFERVVREVCAGLVDPVRGLNRVIYGDAWRMGKKYVDEEGDVPFHFEVGLGYRMLKDVEHDNTDSKDMGIITLSFLYNNPFTIDGKRPFQFFGGQIGLSILGNQPHLCLAKFCASIWGLRREKERYHRLFFGIFQNYSFYNSESLNPNPEDVPYRISETVSYGPGLFVNFPLNRDNQHFTLGGIISGIVLGGALSDHYYVQDRDYNLGSGYSFKFYSLYNLQKFFFTATFENYRIFTWNGYETKDYEHIDPNYLNVQGATGNAQLTVMSLKASLRLWNNFGVSVGTNWYRRNSHYKYFNDVRTKAFELIATATYTL